MGVHDGRDQAALAAWFVLAPNIKDTIDLILAAVAKAKAARTLCARHDVDSIPDTDEELECFTSSEFDSLQERLRHYLEEMVEAEHFYPVPVT